MLREGLKMMCYGKTGYPLRSSLAEMSENPLKIHSLPKRLERARVDGST